MRIAFVTQPGHAVLPATGSIELWMTEVGRRLAGRHDVLVLASRSADTVDTQRDGIRYRFVAHRGERVLRRTARPLWRALPGGRPFFASTLYPLSYWVGVGRALRRERIDVAHVFNYSQALPILRRLAPRTQLVLHMHCEWLTQLDERLVGRRLAQAGAVFCCSTPLTDGVRTRFPAIASRCLTIANGVDTDALDEAVDVVPEPRRLLFVGRISPEKGLHVLMEAFQALHEEHPELELALVGAEEAPAPEMLIRLARDERVRDLERFYATRYSDALRSRLTPEALRRVRFTGAVPYDQVAEHYRKADVFVLPSMMEAFGMPLAEALAMGLPAVAARTGGIVDIVEDEVTGLLVEPGSAAELTTALRRLIEDRALRRALSAAGRERVRSRFSWDAVASSVEAAYAPLVDGRRIRSRAPGASPAAVGER